MKRMYAILDRVAEEFGPIYCAVNDGVALRQYRQVIANAGPKDDYRLYYLGEYNTRTGAICTQAPEEVEEI